MTPYSYVIIRHNNPTFERESVLLSNKYNAKKKYAFIQKSCHKDGSESICFIDYSNDLEALQERANRFVSWYNYVAGLQKNIQGYISETSFKSEPS